MLIISCLLLIAFRLNDCCALISFVAIDPASLLPSQQDPLNTTTTDQPPQLKVFLNHTTDTDNFKPVHKKAAVGAERQAAFDSEFIKAFDCDEGLKTPPDSRPQSSKQSMITATADVLLFPYLIHSQKGDKTYLKVRSAYHALNMFVTCDQSLIIQIECLPPASALCLLDIKFHINVRSKLVVLIEAKLICPDLYPLTLKSPIVWT